MYTNENDYEQTLSAYNFGLIRYGLGCPKLMGMEEPAGTAWYDFPTEKERSSEQQMDKFGDGAAEKSIKGVKLHICLYKFV